MNQTIEVDCDYPPENLLDFIEWAKGILKKIPAEHRDTARIDFDIVCQFNNEQISCEITYSRPETTEEYSKRTNEANQAHVNEIQRAQKYLDRLRGQ